MLIPLDEVVHFDAVTHDPDTGSITDADSAPTFDVFEEATDTPILSAQTMTKRTSMTGDYRGSFTASTANSFVVGRWYSVIVNATVTGSVSSDAISAKKVAVHFRLAAAEDTAGYPKITIKSGTGTGEISLSSGGVAVRGSVKKAAAFAKFMFMMTDSTNHAPATGKTVTATIAKDGGAFGSLNSADTVTEVANGIYEVDLDATDTNANTIVLRFTEATCDDTFERIITSV